MKSLDEAVEKFKALKQKLKSISEQPAKQTPTFPKSNKQNQQNSQNVIHVPISVQPLALPLSNGVQNKKKALPPPPTSSRQNEKQKQQQKQKEYITIQDENIDSSSKHQTQKKSNHRKNNSWNFSNKYIVNEIHQAHHHNNNNEHQEFKVNSLSSSRNQFSRELKEKEKTLEEINDLLERKKQVLETLERKIGYSFLEDSKLDTTMSRSKRAIRAPNLFQMQAEGRKRSKSKTLTIRWK